MSFRDPQNPGIGGLNELTLSEESLVQTLAGLTYSEGDIIYIDANGDFINLGVGDNGDVLTLAAGVPSWAAGGGSGDVTAASSFGTDNRIIRSDGTGKGVQSSGVTLNDSDAISGLTLDADNNTVSNLAIGAEVTGASTDLTDTADITYNADTDVSANGWVVDEDNMTSDLATKVPTQQSVKAYTDTKQTQGDVLDDLNTLGAASTDGEFIVATGAGVFAYESGATVRTSLGLGTADSPQFSTIELGHASDTTLSRSSAGVLAVEGKNVATQFSKSITVEDPTASEDISMFFADDAITITQMNAVLANGSSTPSVTWTIKHSTDRSAAGNEVVTNGTTTTSVSTGSEITSFNDATIPGGSWVWISTTAQSGTVPELSVTIKYTLD